MARYVEHLEGGADFRYFDAVAFGYFSRKVLDRLVFRRVHGHAVAGGQGAYAADVVR